MSWLSCLRRLWCGHAAVDYLGLVQLPDGFHVKGRCLACGKVAVGKAAITTRAGA